jgi:tetratricopeptide (TPR) repeat protein/S1-C subfamily serine protease
MKTATILIASLLLTQIPLYPINALSSQSDTRIAQEDILTPQEVQQTAKNITVRVSSENNGGSGVIIAQKGNNYLILTNAHVIRRATKIEIQAPDGQKYKATPLDGGFDAKYDLALLQFTSLTKYTLPDLSGISSSPIDPSRIIYSAGFPFDTRDIRITKGQVSQLSDIPFDDGTQIGYVTDKGEKGIRQGMSGGAIFDVRGVFLGINTVGVAPILPDYTYNDGSKPLPKLKAQYARANWGIPVYNFLTNVKADILYGYDNLPKVERQVTPTGYLAKLNIKARQMTVRIENSGGSGSGVIVAKEGNSYYVLTAKHVVQDEKSNTHQKFTNSQIITYDQDRRSVSSTVVAEGVDLAVVKFTSSNNYPVATLGEYSRNDYDLAFVGGFPGRLNIKSPLWQWQLNPGYVQSKEQGKFQTQTNDSFSNGYDLIYSNVSYGGMSGGPVFNTVGNVIGIHGRKESIDLNSLGISIQTFTGLLDKLRVDSKLLTIVKTNPVELNLVDRSNIVAAMQNISQPQAGDSGERWLAYGNQLFRTRQLDKAMGAFDRAITRNQELQGNYGKALLLWSTGRYQLAESAIDRAIKVIPPNERVKYYYFWKYQSLILQSLEKYDEALEAINIAIGLERQDLTLLNEKANLLIENKQYSAAITICDEIISKQQQDYAYISRGSAKFALGNKQGAIADYNRAIALNPKYAQAYSNRGGAQYELGNKQEAIDDYNRAIALNHKYAQAYQNRGVVQYELGNKREAIADYNRAIALNPKVAGAYFYRGNIKSDLGNKQEAIADYDRAIVLKPKEAVSYNNRGIAKFALGDNQGAITDYNRAIELNPKLVEAYFNRSNAELALGNNQEVIADCNLAIALNPKNAGSYGNRGLAKYKIGDKQGAIIDTNKAAELFRQQGRVDDYQRAIAYLKQIQGN